jgi:phosphoglycolate phosphatase
MSAYTGVVFDLDGTLVDSSQDITNALNRTLAPFGARALSAQEVTPLLGEGPYRLVEDAIILAGADVPDVESITAGYLADYRKNPIEESTLFEHVAEALAALDARGMPMAVCTNKTEAIAREVLDGLGIGQYFGSVVGADRLANCKPHPDHLITAIAEIGAQPGSSVLIGDSVIDQQCARNANVPFLAVAWAPPEVDGTRFGSFAELPSIVCRIPDPTTT